ncbi:hypothetical protein AMTR_s00044p00124360 [Amborella trichopoda]|uniref:Uncharacterized protein n=1 Tax=Amborella trichopoda TaxID=13333 RepID=U5D9T4_AMBTC|nr:hypothetical protein AMTR_s00044p00124360 [Amborella trichopoda]
MACIGYEMFGTMQRGRGSRVIARAFSLNEVTFQANSTELLNGLLENNVGCSHLSNAVFTQASTAEATRRRKVKAIIP